MNELPRDWSLKSWLDVSVSIKSEKEKVELRFDEFHKCTQYFVYSIDQKVHTLDTLNVVDKDTLKL
jgi:hypothetical protein